ncbi:type IV toxin-antitoxin system AbiEi family antitoxin [Pseudarthrobacter sp. BRE9]|uniref:type IV toxin-antitoxin system AbiEi family antitoxin n=1 Tax=Pseudarthrobacter sp. BRE9 TaxID=2962582 RepID=UPI002880F014|nr:type IV toxin-antitoxin system AbiEi family antitoxin [Pseudarthrobacter sp. BRE9]MDT0168793.1 type IV toxin-antitoxin system AbiEi family antitoxin [Pseudarthrobacter sp. BRE9]
MATPPASSAAGQGREASAAAVRAGCQANGAEPASPPRFPDLYAPGVPFAGPELQSLAADGLLARFHQHGYTLPGVPASPQLRARAAAGVVPPAIRQRVVAGRLTAAWIYGCAGEPDRLALLVDAKRRVSGLRNTRGCTLHEVKLGPFDVISLGGLMVSSPLRTALDIALHVDAERAVPALAGLLARPQQDVGLRLLVRAIEATPRVPHKRAALEKLALLAPALVPGGPVHVENPVDPPDRAQDVAEVLGVAHLESEL